jgi:hypothetical protein
VNSYHEARTNAETHRPKQNNADAPTSRISTTFQPSSTIHTYPINRAKQTHINISITPILPQTILQKPLRSSPQPLNRLFPHDITIRIPIRQNPLPLTMLTPRRHGKQSLMSKLHEQFVKLCSVIATAARSVNFLHGFVAGETAFVGCDADGWAIDAVEVVDVEASIAGEFCVDEGEGCEVCVEGSGEFGERGGEVGVEVVENEENRK